MRSLSSRSTAVLLSVLLVVLSLARVSAITTLTEGDTAALMLKTLQSVESVMTAGAFGSVNAVTGIRFAQTQASGVSNTKVMGTDSCFAMGTMSELLVVYAALQLNSDSGSSFATSLTDPIDTALSPSSLSLTNPHNSLTISYQDLMQHTSTLLDTNFDSSTLSTPNTVGTLASFVEAYLVSNGGALISTVFSTTQEPGASTSFNHARINIALLSYILERVIVTKSLGYDSLKHYIAQEVLLPFGMSSTFFLEVDGTAPGIVAIPDFTGTFTAATVSDTSAYDAYFQGCILDQSSDSVQIHPAYTADYMAYTTLNDMVALASALAIDPRFTIIGTQMLTTKISDVVNSNLLAQNGQGLGLKMFDGSVVCQPATQSQVISDCSLSTSTTSPTPFGYTSSSRPSSTVGFVCAGTTTYGVYCSAGVVIYSSSSARAADPVLALAAANFQESVGVFNLTTPAPTAALRTEGEEDWFGVYVFIAVYGTILIIIFGTSLLQYLFQPAALASHTNTAASTYALTNAPTGPTRQGDNNNHGALSSSR